MKRSVRASIFFFAVFASFLIVTIPLANAKTTDIVDTSNNQFLGDFNNKQVQTEGLCGLAIQPDGGGNIREGVWPSKGVCEQLRDVKYPLRNDKPSTITLREPTSDYTNTARAEFVGVEGHYSYRNSWDRFWGWVNDHIVAIIVVIIIIIIIVVSYGSATPAVAGAAGGSGAGAGAGAGSGFVAAAGDAAGGGVAGTLGTTAAGAGAGAVTGTAAASNTLVSALGMSITSGASGYTIAGYGIHLVVSKLVVGAIVALMVGEKIVGSIGPNDHTHVIQQGFLTAAVAKDAYNKPTTTDTIVFGAAWCGEQWQTTYSTSTISPSALHFEVDEAVQCNNVGQYMLSPSQGTSAKPGLDEEAIYDLPLSVVCSGYDINVLETSHHGEWPPIGKHPFAVLETDTGTNTGKPKKYQYAPATINRNNFKVVLGLTGPGGRLNNIQVSAVDGSGGSGAIAFTVICKAPIDPDTNKDICTSPWAWTTDPNADITRDPWKGHACCGDDATDIKTDATSTGIVKTGAYGTYMCSQSPTGTFSWTKLTGCENATTDLGKIDTTLPGNMALCVEKTPGDAATIGWVFAQPDKNNRYNYKKATTP